jgi:hypothetical protein
VYAEAVVRCAHKGLESVGGWAELWALLQMW